MYCRLCWCVKCRRLFILSAVHPVLISASNVAFCDFLKTVIMMKAEWFPSRFVTNLYLLTWIISTLTLCLIVSSSMCCVHMLAENPNLRLCWVTLHVIGCVLCLLQWLVKRAIETREEMGDYVRTYSISQFQKTHSLPEVTVQYQNCGVNLHVMDFS